MQNIVQKLHKKIFSGCTIEVSAVITNNKNAAGIQKAADLGVRCEILPHTDFESRESFDAALVDLIRGFSPDLTVLAGFMRILTPVFTDSIAAINIHPSLLPLFKGKDGIKESFESGMKVGGVSVHRVSEGMDDGEIIAQRCLPILKTDTFESYKKRVHAVEHEIYPEAVLEALGLS